MAQTNVDWSPGFTFRLKDIVYIHMPQICFTRGNIYFQMGVSVRYYEISEGSFSTPRSHHGRGTLSRLGNISGIVQMGCLYYCRSGNGFKGVTPSSSGSS